MTIIQQILGKQYKWWYLIIYSYNLDRAYFFTNLFHFAGQSISVYTAILIWYFNNPSNDTLTSLIIGLIIFTLSSNTIYWNLGGLIEDGKISRYLILPSNNFGIFASISIGGLLRILIYYIIILMPVLLLFASVITPPGSLLAILLMPFLIIIGFIIRFLIGCIIGFSAFWTVQIYLSRYNWFETVLVFLGGLAWCIILYLIARLIFRMGLKRNEAVGL